jgi:hypothetical protein
MRKLFLLLGGIILLVSCSDNKYSFDKDKSVMIADTIMYTAIVKNPIPQDEYMNEWLQRANIKSLSNILFDAVYAKKLKAYDYITGEKMTIEEVKALEKEYPRDKIAKILFTEEWYFDEVNMQMNKKVNSIMLAYEKRDDSNEVTGYKSGIRIYLNGTKPMKAAINY